MEQVKDKLEIMKEIAEDMGNKIISIDSVISTQIRLVEVLSKENEEEFKDLITETNKQLENLKEQKPLLMSKQTRLFSIISAMENDENTHSIVNNLLDIFGLFE